MSRLNEALSQHAEHCARLLTAAERAGDNDDWAAYASLYADARRAIERRLDFEERSLVPVLRHLRGNGMGSDGLHARRMQLRAKLAELAAADPVRDPDGCLAELRDILGVFDTHRVNAEHAVIAAREALSESAETTLAREAQALNIREPQEDNAVLDVRGLEPPEPMLRIVAALGKAPAAALRVRIHREPIPLYGLLREQGYSWRTEPRADGSFEILIEPSPAAV